MIDKDVICGAIRAGKMVLLKGIDGRARLVEPYAFGRNTSGTHLLRVYQTRPGAAGEATGWKLVPATEIEAVRVLDQTFQGRGDYQRHDIALDAMIYCQR